MLLKRVASDNLPLDLSTAPQHPRMKSPHGSVQLNPSNEPNFSKQRFKKGVKSNTEPMRLVMLKRRASDNLPLDLSSPTPPKHARMEPLHGSVQLEPSNEPNFNKQRFKQRFKKVIKSNTELF